MAGRTFSIATVFKVIDRITAPIRKAQRTTKRFSQSFKASMRGAQVQVAALATTIKTKLIGALTLLASTGILALLTGVALATREFINFDQAVTQAGVKFKDLKPGTVEYKKALVDLGKTARKVGSETQFSATEAAQGLDFLAMAGFNSKQAMALLPKTVELATASNTELARATDIASDSLGAFGLMTNNTAQLTKNLTRVNDVFAKTTTSANTTLELLFESVKKGGPTFKAAGQSMETFSAAAGILANSGIKGSEAGTALRNMMISLSKPTGAAAKVIQKLNVRTQDSNGNFRDAFEILKDVEKGTSKLGTAQKTAALNTLFGKRTVTSMNILLKATGKITKDGTNELEAFRQKLLKSSGAAAAMAKEMRKSLLNRLKILGSSLIEVGLKFVDVFSKRGGTAVEDLTKAVSKFDPKTIAEGILKAVDAVRDFIDTLKPFKEIIFGVLAALALYKLGLLAVAAVQLIVAATNPFTLIVMYIGLVVGATIWLVKNWDKVKVAFSKMWNFILDSFDIPLVKIIGLLFFPLISIPILIIKHWDKVKPVLEDIWARFMRGLNITIGFLTMLWDNIVAGAKTAITWFQTLINDPVWGKVLMILFPFVTIPVLVIKNWKRVKNWFTTFWNGQESLIDSFLKKLSEMWDTTKGIIGDIGSGLAKFGRYLITAQTDDDEDEDDDDEDEIEQAQIAKNLAKQPGALVAQQIQKSTTEKIARSEVTIKDQTGRATMNRNVPGVKLVASGVNP